MSRARPDQIASDAPSAEPRPDATQAFEALVREHYPRLCAFAFRLVGSRELAEDLVHDVLLRLWKERDRFEFRDPLAYLYRALRNRVISDQRSRAGRGRLLAELGTGPEGVVLAPEPADTAATVEGDELARAAAHAVDSLPRRCRLIYTMRREQSLSYGEIARVLDISVKTVENQMTRAAKLLRARLAGYLSLALAVGVSAAEAWRRSAG
jgi:RNA polymerase sigma-70 factor (ECF subfamily)